MPFEYFVLCHLIRNYIISNTERVFKVFQKFYPFISSLNSVIISLEAVINTNIV